MVDSQTSLHQNRTIQKLTYITIGYLPVGLITVSANSSSLPPSSVVQSNSHTYSQAILAIPREQEVVFQPFGLKYYFIALASLFIVTCIVAVKVESIVPFLSECFMRLPRALMHHGRVKRA